MSVGINQFYVKRLTGCYIGGLISKSLNLEHFNPLKKEFWTDDGISRLEFVCDYYGIRYHLLLQQNTEVENCRENALLGRVVKDLKSGRTYEEGIWKCLDCFWPIVRKDSRGREGKTTEKATIKTRFQQKETIKIQLVTTDKNGDLSQVSHHRRCLYPLSEPIANPYPSTVRVFRMEEVELIEEVYGNVFKARIGNDFVCVKAALADDLRTEIEALIRVPHHPNVIHPLIGVVDAGNQCVDKLVIPYIEGKGLRFVREATAQQKVAWKAQLSDAVYCLHKNGIAWGDVARRNVMIHKETDRALIIDFGLSCIDSRFEMEKENDLTMLARLKDEIDAIPLPCPS